jgi:hypothetical protein
MLPLHGQAVHFDFCDLRPYRSGIQAFALAFQLSEKPPSNNKKPDTF